ncbi:MAG: NAD(P)H-hydrate epimerase, partial [Coriobacteriales bacterium]|nr:NAD(P)H-hydrate epimerase [Coriobacteriales bacterium]
VWCEGASEPYLADVGFRKGAALPIKFVEGPVQKDVMGSYKLERDEHGALWLWRTKDDAQFEQLYKIAEKNFKLGDFQERCDYFVHSVGLPLKKKPGASLQSDAGLINMNDEVLLVPRQAQHDTCGGGLNFTFEVSEEINPLSFSKKLISDFGIVAPSPKLSRPINSTTQVYDVEEVVALENELAQTTLPLLDMMQRAGCALAEIAECTLKMQALAMPDDTQTQVVSIFSGSGNNGGDGAVAALELAKLGYGVNLIIPKNPGEYTRQPAKTTFAQLKYENLNVIVNPTQDEISKILEETNLILDCILGCGFSYDKVREPYAIWIKLINKISQEKSIPLISADVPSGMNAQTGELADCAIYADLTLTMLRAKHGLMEKDAKAQAGMIFLADLEL